MAELELWAFTIRDRAATDELDLLFDSDDSFVNEFDLAVDETLLLVLFADDFELDEADFDAFGVCVIELCDTVLLFESFELVDELTQERSNNFIMVLYSMTILC